jgi:protein-tyrosine kinase
MTLLFGKRELQPDASKGRADKRMLGEILVGAGKITDLDVARVLALQQQAMIPFGQAAIRLSLLTPKELTQALAEQYDYAFLGAGDLGLSRELATAYDPFGLSSEAVRTLRTELMLRWFDGKQRVLAVTSPDKGDGRSYLAANLAVSFSQLGEKTLLIDADMRASRQHAIFNVPNRVGLSSVLGGRVVQQDEAILGFANLPDLSLMPAGPMPPNPLELIGQPVFANLLSELALHYDVVLLDTPAAARNADGRVVASRAGGALIVARKDHTRAQDVRALADSLAASGTGMVGVAFNRY